MSNFAIITDSCSDLEKDLRVKYDIDYVCMRCLYDGNDEPASLDWKFMPYKDFYGKMKSGAFIKMAQVPYIDYYEKFSYYLEKGQDVLSVSCSTALSASYHASVKAAKELREKYPDRKIFCIDSLNSCMGLGLINILASKMRAAGKSVDEVAAYIEEHKLEMNQFATVEDLKYLKRAGRVKAAAAFFGGLMQVKPIIISDACGQNFAVEKVKGRRNSIARITELFLDTYNAGAYLTDVFVSHADDRATAEAVKEELKKKLPEGTNVGVAVIGPIVGASVGPGTVAIFGFGKKVTTNEKTEE